MLSDANVRRARPEQTQKHRYGDVDSHPHLPEGVPLGSTLSVPMAFFPEGVPLGSTLSVPMAFFPEGVPSGVDMLSSALDWICVPRRRRCMRTRLPAEHRVADRATHCGPDRADRQTWVALQK